jgi:hypothetical protein
MTTDDHFEAAVNGNEPTAEVVNEEAAQTVTDKAAQNAARDAHDGCHGDSQSSNRAHEKTPALLGSASSGAFTQLPGLAGTGFEPATSRL